MQYWLITKDNVRIHYQVWGDDQAPAILLIMGLGMPSEAWPEEFIGGLVRQGFRVITMDNRDSGQSSRIDIPVGPFGISLAILKTLFGKTVQGPYSLEDMAADAEAVLDAVHVKRAHVLGISMGGMIAQVMALNSPQRVSSLISVMSASGNPRTGLGKWSAIAALLKHPKSETDLSSMAHYIHRQLKVIGAGFCDYEEQQIYQVAKAMVDNPPIFSATERQLLAILVSGNRSESLKRIKVPTLVIHGKQDPLLPLKASEELARLIPNARLMVIDKMGHGLPRQHLPGIVAAVAKHCHRYKE